MFPDTVASRRSGGALSEGATRPWTQPVDPAPRAQRVSTSATLWRKARSAIFCPVPSAERVGFARSLAYTNWLHANWVAAGAIAVNAVFGLMLEMFYYRTGYWPADADHLLLSGLHVFMVVFSLGALVVLRRRRPRLPGQGRILHQRLAMGYATVMLVAVTLFSIVEQRLTGSISAYLLGVAAFATLFYSSPRFSLVTMGGSLLVLAAGSTGQQPAPSMVWHQLFVALDAVVLFWVGSRIVYYLKAQNHLHLVTIEQQTRALALSNAELAHANQFKTELLALAAHDLREPLGGISLSAQTLREELPPGSPLRSLVDGIDDSALHLAEFIGNFLTGITSETHQISVESVPTELANLLTDIVTHLRSVAVAKSIDLQLTLGAPRGELPPALVDPTCFRQIVENLVRNAIKYSPPHRSVWVELSHFPGEGHRLSVRDEGPGLTADDHRRLFRKYQRLSARPTGGEKSTGLGLYIVKHLVTLHRGQVWAESAGPGQGATFFVMLPDVHSPATTG